MLKMVAMSKVPKAQLCPICRRPLTLLVIAGKSRLVCAKCDGPIKKPEVVAFVDSPSLKPPS